MTVFDLTSTLDVPTFQDTYQDSNVIPLVPNTRCRGRLINIKTVFQIFRKVDDRKTDFSIFGKSPELPPPVAELDNTNGEEVVVIVAENTTTSTPVSNVITQEDEPPIE